MHTFVQYLSFVSANSYRKIDNDYGYIQVCLTLCIAHHSLGQFLWKLFSFNAGKKYYFFFTKSKLTAGVHIHTYKEEHLFER